MDVTFVAQIVLGGLLIGGVYALVASGFSLIWGVLNIVNLAHGGFMMLGAYVTYLAFDRLGIDPFVSIAISAPLMFAFGYITYRFVLHLVSRRATLSTVTLTYGLLLIMVNGAEIFLGTESKSVQASYAGASVEVGGVLVPLVRVMMFAFAVVLLGAIALFMSRTHPGRAITATRMDATAAQLCGVNADRIYFMTFALAAATAGATGSLFAVAYAFSPHIALWMLPKMFVVVVLAGLGNFRYLLAAGVILGLAETGSTALIGGSFQVAVSYAVLVLILMIRPQGLGGRAFLK